MRNRLLVGLLVGATAFGAVPLDKQAHFLGGAVIGLTATHFAQKAALKHPALWGIGASVLAWVGKEVLDSKRKGNRFDKNDAMATALGGITFSYVVTW